MREKTKWLEKYAPLGTDVHSQLMWYVAGVGLATIQSMLFLLRYMSARNALYERYAGKMVLIEGAVIEDFAVLITGTFIVLAIECGILLFYPVFNYMYHYQESKMIYLMRRLPDKWELHRRCLTLPIAGAAILAVWGLVLRMMYFAIYMLCTPSQCLPL